MKKTDLIKIRLNLFQKLNSRYGLLIRNKKNNEAVEDFRCQYDYITATTIVVIDDLLKQENVPDLDPLFYPSRIEAIFTEIEKENLKL